MWTSCLVSYMHCWRYFLEAVSQIHSCYLIVLDECVFTGISVSTLDIIPFIPPVVVGSFNFSEVL